MSEAPEVPAAPVEVPEAPLEVPDLPADVPDVPEAVPGVGVSPIEPDEPGPEQLTDAELEVAAELERLPADAPRVALLTGSDEMDALDPARDELDRHRILHESRVFHSEEDAEPAADYARNAKLRGLQVVIAAAGEDPALTELVAAHTELPVIAVPLGADAAEVGRRLMQAPPDRPIAVVGPEAAVAAGALAARIVHG